MNKTILFFLTGILLVFAANNIQGQGITISGSNLGLTKDPELAKEALSRKLIVVTSELTEKQKKKYSKKGVLQEMEQIYAMQNEKLKEIFANTWKLNKEIEYKTESELNALKKAKSTDYVYVNLIHMIDRKEKKNPITGFKTIYYYSYYVFTLSFTDKPLKRIGIITTRGGVLNDLEYYFASNTLQYFIDYCTKGNKRSEFEETINQEAAKLKNKTLLLPDFLTKLEEEEIKANYPYPVKVLPENEIIEIIKEKNPAYAYAYVNHKLNSCGTRFNHLIVDCETGALLLFDKRNGVSLGTSKYVNISDDIATIRSIAGKGHEQQNLFKQKFIKAKQLKKYAEIINGKYDNKVEEEEAE